MAHSYTPGLKVTASTRIRRERKLPLPGDVLVTVGQTVTADTIVARTELRPRSPSSRAFSISL